ncbi:hypothetical protein H7B90_22305 [Cohnella xylanilytica]|uniref:Glycosyl transferase family 2 n=1 Tax=Cohnella xylanilytica TaxID=557555 RepID=A0A841U2Y5_9BACL|nr:hypothetical protein [Cohnella xylanilytica]MBB6694139.1 hypothetical protein [Cohnella xylanilytica]
MERLKRRARASRKVGGVSRAAAASKRRYRTQRGRRSAAKGTRYRRRRAGAAPSAPIVPSARPAASAASLAAWRREGMTLGAAWRSEHPSGTPEELKSFVQERWTRMARDGSGKPGTAPGAGWAEIWERGRAFGEGAMEGAGLPSGFVPVPLQGSAAAVLYAEPMSARSLTSVLSVLDLLPLTEIVIVSGNAPESWLTAARSHPKATIAHDPDAVHADVGRALGAKLTGADIVLFVDGEQPAPAEELARFLWECDGRLDVALNDVSPEHRMFNERNAVLRLHEFLNVTLGRADLKMNTMASLPFALSRNALDSLGSALLAVPVKAHAAAVLRGLRIGTAGEVRGPSPFGAEAPPPLLRVAAGDHIEAWREAMTARGSRLHFVDRARNRGAVGGVTADAGIHHNPDE